MKWIEELSKLRNELYEDLPKGETTAWELLSLIKVHINDLDSFINRNSASLPSSSVTGESEAIPIDDLHMFLEWIDKESWTYGGGEYHKYGWRSRESKELYKLYLKQSNK